MVMVPGLSKALIHPNRPTLGRHASRCQPQSAVHMACIIATWPEDNGKLHPATDPRQCGRIFSHSHPSQVVVDSTAYSWTLPLEGCAHKLSHVQACASPGQSLVMLAVCYGTLSRAVVHLKLRHRPHGKISATLTAHRPHSSTL